MTREIFSENEFLPNTPPEQLITVVERLRDLNFYAPVLVDTFLEQVNDETLVADMDRRYSFFAVGGRIKDHPQGYIRLNWSRYASPDLLKMQISLFSQRADKGRERDSLIYGEGHYGGLTVESNGKAFGPIASYAGDGKWNQETISNLTISFYSLRTTIAPTNPSKNFNYWLLSQFVPDLLENKVAPFANIPREEMTGSVIIDDPEPD